MSKIKNLKSNSSTKMVLVVLGVLTCAVGLYDLFSKGIEDYDFTALFFGLVLISSAYFFDSAGDN